MRPCSQPALESRKLVILGPVCFWPDVTQGLPDVAEAAIVSKGVDNRGRELVMGGCSECTA